MQQMYHQQMKADGNGVNMDCTSLSFTHTLLKAKAAFWFCFDRCNSLLLFSGQTALHLSSENGHLEVCRLLVECQANVNAKDYRCNARTLHLILNAKAGLRFSFERCNSLLLFSEQTALHLCSWNDHVEVCKLLVEYEADVNRKDDKCNARIVIFTCF
jgi:hypothetical protein